MLWWQPRHWTSPSERRTCRLQASLTKGNEDNKGKLDSGSFVAFCYLSDPHPCYPRAERAGSVTQKVKPRRAPAREAGAERVSNPWFLRLRFFIFPETLPIFFLCRGMMNTALQNPFLIPPQVESPRSGSWALGFAVGFHGSGAIYHDSSRLKGPAKATSSMKGRK
jgi:hypothetical protein